MKKAAGLHVRPLSIFSAMMHEAYGTFSTADRTIYGFVSRGLRGDVWKIVQFQETEVPNLYNLSLSDRDDATGRLRYDVITNNGDLPEVLATVANTVVEFLKNYPAAEVSAAGNTPARTRLYRMGITNNLEVIQEQFVVLGLVDADWLPFEIGKEYAAFRIRRKV